MYRELEKRQKVREQRKRKKIIHESTLSASSSLHSSESQEIDVECDDNVDISSESQEPQYEEEQSAGQNNDSFIFHLNQDLNYQVSPLSTTTMFIFLFQLLKIVIKSNMSLATLTSILELILQTFPVSSCFPKTANEFYQLLGVQENDYRKLIYCCSCNEEASSCECNSNENHGVLFIKSIRQCIQEIQNKITNLPDIFYR